MVKNLIKIPRFLALYNPRHMIQQLPDSEKKLMINYYDLSRLADSNWFLIITYTRFLFFFFSVVKLDCTQRGLNSWHNSIIPTPIPLKHRLQFIHGLLLFLFWTMKGIIGKILTLFFIHEFMCSLAIFIHSDLCSLE